MRRYATTVRRGWVTWVCGGALVAATAWADGFGERAFRYEEYAWAKAHGIVDKDPALVGGVRRSQEGYFGAEYNLLYRKDTHLEPVAQDRLPLPELSSAPRVDGQLDDPCWRSASRGSARVAFPDEDRESPLAEYSVRAGRREGWLFLACETDRPDPRIAAVSTSKTGRGDLVFDETGQVRLVWRKSEAGQGLKLVELGFAPRPARFVRVVLEENTGSPGIDELEIFGPGSERNLALQTHGAKASASSCIAGYKEHRVEHLNDGRLGNGRSWIAEGDRNEWAAIELPEAAEVASVRFSRDRTGAYQDRLPVRGRVEVSLDGKAWTVAGKFPQGAATDARLELTGGRNASGTVCEVGIPLAALPGWEGGVTVEVGMGGLHLGKEGRRVRFVPSRLFLAQEGSCAAGTFQLRLGVAKDGGAPVVVRGSLPAVKHGLTLAPGESRTIEMASASGPLGPEGKATFTEGDAATAYELHLFQYDPLARVLDLLDGMVGRLRRTGLKVEEEERQLASLRQRQQQLRALAARDLAAEGAACREARRIKRELFFRQPELTALRRVLFVKRQAFQPSHNYSVQLDGRFVGGGGICLLDVPLEGDRLAPEAARVTELYGAGAGVVDTPMADFEANRIYFCQRKTKEDYYHLMRMNADGSGVQQLTDGSYHDTWPCPLPDGGLAFISTRIGLRFLCWRPQTFVLYRMEADGSGMRPLSFANLSEWAPSVMSDGRILWTRSEYLDKGANFGHTLWCIRPDGSMPELVFGNGIMQPSGYANGRQVPGTTEVACTMISHFGDLNGPIALCDTTQGRSNPDAISNLTPEVLSVGNPWPSEECFRECVPLSKDLFLVAHAPRPRFGLYVIDRYGNREHLYSDTTIESLCPTPFRAVSRPPVLGGGNLNLAVDYGVFSLRDLYNGLEPAVARGSVKYLRVVEEVPSVLERLPDGRCREDHPDFLEWYAAPVHHVSGPFGWPSFVAKASHGIVPVAEDGSVTFYAPARKVLYFQALDGDFNELQRMRSVVQLQPGEQRSCVGCHEDRRSTPRLAMGRLAAHPANLEQQSWEGRPLSYERVVQPVWDAQCVRCHDGRDKTGITLAGTLDTNSIPASYRTLIEKGWVHYADMNWEKGGLAIVPPRSVGSTQSKVLHLLAKGHYDVRLTRDEAYRLKTWIDCNCPLWPDYRDRRPESAARLSSAQR